MHRKKNNYNNYHNNNRKLLLLLYSLNEIIMRIFYIAQNIIERINKLNTYVHFHKVKRINKQ